jgi:hypothetical protein
VPPIAAGGLDYARRGDLAALDAFMAIFGLTRVPNNSEFEPANPDRAQLAALADDAGARAHAARLERTRRERLSRAADHWAD